MHRRARDVRTLGIVRNSLFLRELGHRNAAASDQQTAVIVLQLSEAWWLRREPFKS
jgi:hypothetical protein